MTNLKRADAAIAAYDEKLDEDEKRQLHFFRAIWGTQAQIATLLSTQYQVPGIDQLKRLAEKETAVLNAYPAKFDERVLVEASQRVAKTICETGGYADEVIEQVLSVDWTRACGPVADIAGRYPTAYTEYVYNSFKQEGMNPRAAQTAVSAASLGLRALLDPISTAVMKARETAGLEDKHPVHCPVCGCGATLAAVGASTETSGGARTLWCGQCGATWNYDRVRCARCGTRNQGHLHYYHIEGDDAHRIQTCDECGDYTRTVFQEDVFAPVCPDVEDVVMIKLDLLAAQQASEPEDGQTVELSEDR